MNGKSDKFNEFLRTCLKGSGIKQQRLAWLMGIPFDTLANFLGGKVASLKVGPVHELIGNPDTPEGLREQVRSVFFGTADANEVCLDLDGDGDVDAADLKEALRRQRSAGIAVEAITEHLMPADA